MRCCCWISGWIRDPDSHFSATWDLVQVALLLYVAVTVPLRAGFELEVPLWSVGFFVDMAIDVYFVTDICLNFRTAFYDEHGVCEDRGSYIAWYSTEIRKLWPYFGHSLGIVETLQLTAALP